MKSGYTTKILNIPRPSALVRCSAVASLVDKYAEIATLVPNYTPSGQYMKSFPIPVIKRLYPW